MQKKSVCGLKQEISEFAFLVLQKPVFISKRIKKLSILFYAMNVIKSSSEHDNRKIGGLLWRNISLRWILVEAAQARNTIHVFHGLTINSKTGWEKTKPR